MIVANVFELTETEILLPLGQDWLVVATLSPSWAAWTWLPLPLSQVGMTSCLPMKVVRARDASQSIFRKKKLDTFFFSRFFYKSFHIFIYQYPIKIKIYMPYPDPNTILSVHILFQSTKNESGPYPIQLKNTTSFKII